MNIIGMQGKSRIDWVLGSPATWHMSFVTVSVQNDGIGEMRTIYSM